MNLFLTEDGVLKLGYYGLTTQAECYSLLCKASMKADKMHKSRKKHAKTGRKSRRRDADKMNNIRIYTEKPA